MDPECFNTTQNEGTFPKILTPWLSFSSVIYKIAIPSLILLIFWHYYHCHFTSVAKKINKFPGLPYIPLIGSFAAIRTAIDLTYIIDPKKSPINPLEGISRFWVGHLPILIIKDPAMVQKILTSPTSLEKSDVLVKPLLPSLKENSILIATNVDDFWKTKRKYLNPGLSKVMNADFLQVFHHQLKYLDAVLEEKCVTGEEFNIDGMFGKFTTGAGFTTILDWPVPVNMYDENSLPGFYQAFQDAAHIASHPVLNPWFSFRPLWHLAGYEKKLQKAFVTMRKHLSKELLLERMAYWKEYEKNGAIQEKMKCMNILYTKCTDPDEIFLQVLTILAAAVDSTDSVLCETFVLLAQNPDVQKKAYEEARRVIGDDYDTPLRSEDVAKLTYITMVLKETMRLIPPVPTLVRKVMEEMDVGNGLVIPKYTNVFIPVLTLHQDPKVFPKPEEFIPERFLPENVLNRHRCSYLPFSAGERICIGEKYVMPEMKFTVAKILYKYEIFTKMEMPLEKMKVVYMPFSKFKDGLTIHLKPRVA